MLEWTIETARLRLRPPCMNDAPLLTALMTPTVSRWLASWPVPFTLELAQARIAEAREAMAQGGAICCVIEHRGEAAGWIGAARLPGTHRASFGYWLGEPWHGQALMQEAAPAFVVALRTRLALDSIEATCQPANRGSARVLAACGLKRVGTRNDYAPARDRDELLDLWERTWTRLLPD